MKAFIRDMIIGWILYTESGKKVANKIVNYAYKQIKGTLSSTEIDKTPIKREHRNNNDKQQFNNRTKN